MWSGGYKGFNFESGHSSSLIGQGTLLCANSSIYEITSISCEQFLYAWQVSWKNSAIVSLCQITHTSSAFYAIYAIGVMTNKIIPDVEYPKIALLTEHLENNDCNIKARKFFSLISS